MRISYLDTISGFFIIQIIIGHLLQFCGLYVYMSEWTKVFCFFMPFFYFKSGIFAKLTTDKITLTSINPLVKKLLVPYVGFTLLGLYIKHAF